MVLPMAARRRGTGYAGLRARPRPTTGANGPPADLGTTLSTPITLAQNPNPTNWHGGGIVTALAATQRLLISRTPALCAINTHVRRGSPEIARSALVDLVRADPATAGAWRALQDSTPRQLLRRRRRRPHRSETASSSSAMSGPVGW